MGERRKVSGMKGLEEIIYPEIEPGIITKDMICQAYLDDGKQGEEKRLHQLEPVVFDKVKSIRLEFKNILRIDHLWIMPNLTKLSLNCNKIETIEHIEMLTQLKELDLSFNYIERIENLDKLVHIEVLSLFNNLITKIENLDSLQKLQILSLGNNKITSLAGIERFRFFEGLQALNLEGNPIAQNTEKPLSLYIAAILPNLTYYEYVAITPEDREEAIEMFYREIREIEANEELEIVARENQAKEKLDADRLASSFVEHLNDNQLYESFWKGDEDGRILMLVGPNAIEVAEEYQKDIFEITQSIYKFGLTQFDERESEINEFMSNLEEGLNEVQRLGQNIIENFLNYKEKLFESVTACLKALEIRAMQGEDEESPESLELNDRYEKLTMDFEENTNEVWQQLMGQELHLHETIEETTINFQRKVQEMMSKFIEKCQTYFGQLREIALHFSESLSEVVFQYISIRLAMQDFSDVEPELRRYIEDRDQILSMIAGMKDSHTQRIDEREDRMMVRCKAFIEDMIDKLNTGEVERNREKILEINSFLELTTEQLNSLQHDVREAVLNEDIV